MSPSGTLLAHVSFTGSWPPAPKTRPRFPPFKRKQVCARDTQNSRRSGISFAETKGILTDALSLIFRKSLKNSLKKEEEKEETKHTKFRRSSVTRREGDEILFRRKVTKSRTLSRSRASLSFSIVGRSTEGTRYDARKISPRNSRHYTSEGGGRRKLNSG